MTYDPPCPFVEMHNPIDAPSDRNAGPRFNNATQPLIISATFPVPRYVPIRLYRHFGRSAFSESAENQLYLRDGHTLAEIFDVVTDDPHLPFDRYEIVHIADDSVERYVVHARPNHRDYSVTDSKRSWLDVELNEQPHRWAEARLHLARVGAKLELQTLTMENEALRRLLAELDVAGRTVSMLDLSLPLTVAVTFLGVIVLAVSLQFLGPLTVLRSHNDAVVRSDWVMLIPATHKLSITESLVTVVSAGFALAPVGILIYQSKSGILTDVTILYAVASFGGAAGATFILAATAIELRRRRLQGTIKK